MKSYYLLCLFLILSLSGCGTLNGSYNAKKVMNVEIGMSKSEISRLFGEPSYRRLDSEKEEWEYQSLNLMKEGMDVLIIGFVNGKVSDMNSFFLPKPCPVVVPDK